VRLSNFVAQPHEIASALLYGLELEAPRDGTRGHIEERGGGTDGAIGDGSDEQAQLIDQVGATAYERA